MKKRCLKRVVSLLLAVITVVSVGTISLTSTSAYYYKSNYGNGTKTNPYTVTVMMDSKGERYAKLEKLWNSKTIYNSGKNTMLYRADLNWAKYNGSASSFYKRIFSNSNKLTWAGAKKYYNKKNWHLAYRTVSGNKQQIYLQTTKDNSSYWWPATTHDESFTMYAQVEGKYYVFSVKVFNASR